MILDIMLALYFGSGVFAYGIFIGMIKAIPPEIRGGMLRWRLLGIAMILSGFVAVASGLAVHRERFLQTRWSL